MSYKDLSKKMKMSESNLKRIFSQGSCSIQILEKMCQASGISLAHLIETSARNHVPHYELSQDDVDYFMENFDAFIFYRNFFCSDDKTEYLKNTQVSQVKIIRYLQNLEKLKLVRKVRDKYEITDRGYLNLDEAPQLKKKIKDHWVPWFFQRVLWNESHDRNYKLAIASTGLNSEHRSQLLNEIEQLTERYKLLGMNDQLSDGDVQSVGICIGVGPHRVGLFEESKGQVIYNSPVDFSK